MAFQPGDLELTSDGYLPVGVDVDEVVTDGWERDLTAIWCTYHVHAGARGLDPDSIRPLELGRGPTTTEGEFQRRLAAVNAQYAPVTALQALAANARLVDLLLDFRWEVINDAVGDGKSWNEIATALGQSEKSVLDWYTQHRRAIAALEQP